MGCQQRSPFSPHHADQPHRRRERDPRHLRQESNSAFAPRHEGYTFRFEAREYFRYQGLDSSFVGHFVRVGAAEYWAVPAGVRPGHLCSNPRVSPTDQNAVHGESVPVLWFQTGDVGLRVVQAQRRSFRQRYRKTLHKYVRRATRRGSLSDEEGRLRRRGHRGSGNRMALRRRSKPTRREHGERHFLQPEPREACKLREGNAIDAEPNLRNIHLLSIQRESQTIDIREELRPFPTRSNSGLRRRHPPESSGKYFPFKKKPLTTSAGEGILVNIHQARHIHITNLPSSGRVVYGISTAMNTHVFVSNWFIVSPVNLLFCQPIKFQHVD